MKSVTTRMHDEIGKFRNVVLSPHCTSDVFQHVRKKKKTSRMSIEQRGIAIGFMNVCVPHAKLRHIFCRF